MTETTETETTGSTTTNNDDQTAGQTDGDQTQNQEGTQKEGEPGKDETQKAPETSDQKAEDYQLKRDDESLISNEKFEDIAKYAKDAGLTREQAENLLDLQEDAIGDRIEKLQAEHKTKVEEWEKELAAGKEFSKDKSLVEQAIKKFGDDKLAKELKATGYMHYGPMWELFKNIGKALKDDNFVAGEGPKTGDKPNREGMSLGKKMFPYM